MDYRQALNYIENTGKFGSRLGLENVSRLLDILGNPHRDLRIIHVAGTNGKGSTCSFINSMLIYQGYNVGLYTSPYLEEFNERIKINNVNISDEDLAQSVSRVSDAIGQMIEEGCDHPTEFEIITACAFLYFRDRDVDFAVIEVGLGGRLDATNVCIPLVSAITSISMDHTEYLGDTLARIAFEKGGIIKNKRPVVLYQQSDEVESVISSICSERDSELFITENDKIEYISEGMSSQSVNLEVMGHFYSGIEISLPGRHQARNLAVALSVLRLLEISSDISQVDTEALYRSIRETRWPGRMEVIKTEPLTIIDGAHNPDGAAILSESVDRYLVGKKINLVFGMLRDKDILSVANLLAVRADRIIITEPESPRAASSAEVHGIILEALSASILKIKQRKLERKNCIKKLIKKEKILKII